MHIDLFDFNLPRDRIAQQPASPRDSSRLLVVDDAFQDCSFRDLPDLLRPGDLLVTNDTKVIPARLNGYRPNAQGGFARVEVTLHKKSVGSCWHAFARPARKLRPGDRIFFAEDFQATVEDKNEAGDVVLRFNLDDLGLIESLDRYGIMPLPPYIERPASGQDQDRENYQTLFARSYGAVAAPTAGLHFTDTLVTRLQRRGVDMVQLTLHVGAGTFLPVKAEEVEDHPMHGEYGQITETAAMRINETRRNGGRIVAVGTTSLRLLETAAAGQDHVQSFEGETDIFILPGYRFRAADCLITNFHLPRSTLFMLVAAFSGLEQMKAAYQHAIDRHYRFYSYGDACLLTCRSNAP